jgi:putative hemolysin
MLKEKASSSLENELNLDQQPSTNELFISFARNPSEIEEAQRLRYKVFAEEMGADIANPNGLDCDGFDAFCDHLLIRESNTNQVVGTYRILSPKMADEAGGYYSAGEFDMSRLQHLFPQMVEWRHDYALVGWFGKVYANASL